MASRDWMEKDFYKVLGVSKGASKDEIKKAYRKLAQKFHPDANKEDKTAERRFKEISEAHAVLSHDEKRKEYDQMRALAESGGERLFGFQPGGRNVRVTVGDIGDLFDEGGVGGLFEDLLGGYGPGFRAPRGQDLESEVELSFEAAVNGVTVSVDGTKVRIPPGVKDGSRIRVPGKGRPGPQARPPGDLYVRVRVRPHPLFTQGKNGDLVVRVPVTFTEAALGATIDVPTLNGPVRVKVPAGTQHGRTLRVKGKGAPRPGGGSGDLLAKIEVEVPQRLTKKEREVLEQFAQLHTASPRKHLKDATRTDEKVS